MKDAFLSFNSADRERVRQIQRLLEARGISTFVDQDQMIAGQPAIPQLEHALRECRAVAVFLGRAVGAWQQREIWMALGRQIEGSKRNVSFPVVPVLLPGADPRLGFLTSNSWIDLRADGLEAPELDALARAVRGEGAAGAEPVHSDFCPFRGLEPFREEDAALFFGRERFVESLAQRAETARLLAVVGSSGSGKSSVVLAGLVPALRKRRPPQRTWEALTFTPGGDPFARLASEVVAWLDPQLARIDQVSRAQKLGGELSRGELRLGAFLEEGLRAWGADRLLLVVDQFEEIITQAKAEQRKPFVDALVVALEEAPVLLVLTVRGDFYGAACDLDSRLSALVQEGVVNLGPPSRDELSAAIEKPAALAGLKFEPPLLVEKLLDDVGDEPGNLPLLEYALLELWNGRTGNSLQATTYQGINGLSGAIAARAEAVFNGLPVDHQTGARNLLLRLVQTSASTSGFENTRRRALVEDFGAESREVLQAFAAKGVRLLVTARDEQGRQTVEVAHERLIHAWDRLQRWLAEDTEFRLWRQRLEPSLEYFRRDRANVLVGSPLAEAERWLDERREALLDAERELIEESLAAGRRRVRLVWAGVAMSIALAIAAGFGWWSARNQEKAARRAAAATSFAEGQDELENGRPDRALAHLAKAVRLDPSWDAPRALTSSLLHVSPVPHLLLKGRIASISQDGRWIVTSAGSTAQVWDAASGSAVVLLRHVKEVRSASFSPDSRWVVTASEDQTAQVWETATGMAVGPPLSHDHWVLGASFSPDGRWVVTASADRSARLWEAATGATVGVPLRHENWVLSATFSSDGRWILTVTLNGTARVWEASTGMAIGAPLLATSSASFSPSGRWAATVSRDGTARLWEVATGAAVGEPLHHEGPVLSASFSPDSRWIVTTSADRTARLWDVATGAAVGVPLRHEDSVLSASFSPDSRRIVTGSSDGTARLWEAATGAAVGVPLRHEGWVLSTSFSPDGRWVVTFSDGTARVWEAATRSVVGVPLRHNSGVRSASFSPDGRSVVTALDEGTARLWEATGAVIRELPSYEDDSVRSASFSPDGRWVVTASDAAARVWEAATGAAIGKPLRHDAFIWKSSFSPSRHWLVTASEDGTARVWEAATGSAIGEPLTHEGSVRSALFSPDSRWVVTASDDGTARVWEAATGAAVGEPLSHGAAVCSASFSPDGRWVVTASEDETARVWEAATGTAVGEPLSHEASVLSASFSPDSRRVVTASGDGTARVWEAATGAAVGAPLRHEEAVSTASFSPDGRWVVTASQDRTARVWEAATGAPVGEPLRHEGAVSSASFSPDGRWIVTASDDRTARLWPVILGTAEEAALIADLAEAVGGSVATAAGLEPLPDREKRLADLRRRASEAPLGERTVLSFARWFFEDHWGRTINPLSTVTVPYYICDALRHDAWAEAYRHFPGRPLLKRGAEGQVPAECGSILSRGSTQLGAPSPMAPAP